MGEIPFSRVGESGGRYLSVGTGKGGRIYIPSSRDERGWGYIYIYTFQ